MLEYRIPLAGFISLAIFSVCLIVALIMINSGTTGRARRFGLLGLLLIFGSTSLQAVNRSVSSVYGTETLAYVIMTLVVGVLAAGGLVLLALAVARSPRTKKKRGEL